MTQAHLIYPMATHIGFTAFLYALLTIARAPSVWGLGRCPDGSNPWGKFEPRISANLSNQFEWPLFFYIVCLLLLQHPVVEEIQVWFAWLFIVGRLAHSYVQILTANVRLRGLVFTINFIAVLAMWGLLVASESNVGRRIANIAVKAASLRSLDIPQAGRSLFTTLELIKCHSARIVS